MEANRNNSNSACAQFDAEVEAYLEGEARPFIDFHARGCFSCGALLADLQSIRQAARTLPLEEPSPAVWANLHADLVAEGAFGLPACLRFENELEASWGGEANSFIASHARDCASCGALLADLEWVRQAAGHLPLEEPSPAVWANLHARLAAEGAFAIPACSKFHAGMEAYLEGEANPFITSHAQDCTSCGILLSDLQSIRDAARNLPREEPSRVVWANVRARLEAEGAFRERAGGWRQLLGWRLVPHAIPLGVLAALVFLASALTLPPSSFERWGGAEETASSPAVAQIASVLPAGEDGALALVVSNLESSFRANEASMAPDLKATYEKSLVSLDGSIKECLDSLQHEPRNTLAHDYLVTAYTRKAEVLSSALEFDGR